MAMKQIWNEGRSSKNLYNSALHSRCSPSCFFHFLLTWNRSIFFHAISIIYFVPDLDHSAIPKQKPIDRSTPYPWRHFWHSRSILFEKQNLHPQIFHCHMKKYWLNLFKKMREKWKKKCYFYQSNRRGVNKSPNICITLKMIALKNDLFWVFLE